MLTAAERLQQPARFLAATAAQFGHDPGILEPVDDVDGVAPEKPLVGARQAVFREHADDFKQCGADVVVQVFRREFFLAEVGKPGTDVGGELVQRVGIDSVGQHKSLRSVLDTTKSGIRVLEMGLKPVAE